MGNTEYRDAVEEPQNAQEACSRRSKRQPGGYRCKITHPVEPYSLLGKRATVKWNKVEKLDGQETLTPKWFEGVVHGYSPGECKHTMDYDNWDKEVPVELRIGLDDAVVEVDMAQVPPKAPKDFLLKLQSLLSKEVQVEAEQLQPGKARDKAQIKLKQKQQQVAVVTEMLNELQAEEDAAAAAAAAAAEREAARRRPLPKDCPIMKRVGPVLADKWAQQQQSGSVAQPAVTAVQRQCDEAAQPAAEQPPQSAAAEENDAAMQEDGDQPHDASAQQQQPDQQPAQPAAQRSRHGRLSLREVLALSQAQSTPEKEHVEQHLQAAVVGAGRVTRHTHEPHAAAGHQQTAQVHHVPAAAEAAPAEADNVPAEGAAPSGQCDMEQQDVHQQDMQQQVMQQQDVQQEGTQQGTQQHEAQPQDTQQGPPAKKRKLRDSHLQEPEQQEQHEVEVPPGAKVPAELRALLLDRELEKTGRSFTRKSTGRKQQQQQVEVPHGQEQAASVEHPQQQPVGSAAAQQQAAAVQSDDSRPHRAADAADSPAVEEAEQHQQGDPALLRQQQEAAARLRRKPRRSGSGAAAVLSGAYAAAAAEGGTAPETQQQQQQQLHRSPLQPLPAGDQQRPADFNTSGWQAQGQCSEQRFAAGKCVSEPSGLSLRTRRRSEQQQEQLGGSAAVSADKLLELPMELRRLDPRWDSLANWNRHCRETKQQQQKEQQPQEEEQQCVDAEPITGQPDDDSCCHQQHRQQQQQARQELQQAQQSSRSSKLPRELQQLLVEAPDVDQPPGAERRPTRSAASSRSQSRATAPDAEPDPAQQQQQQRAESVSACQQRQATDQCRVDSKRQATPVQPTAAAAATIAAAARLRQPSKKSGSAQALSSGSRPARGSSRQSNGYTVRRPDPQFRAVASGALQARNAGTTSNAVSHASAKDPQKQQQQQQKQVVLEDSRPVPTTPALAQHQQQQQRQRSQLPLSPQSQQQQQQQQAAQQGQQPLELLEAQPMELDDPQPQQEGVQQVPGAAIAAPAVPADNAAADEVRHAVPPPAQLSGPSAEASVRSQQAQQQRPQQQQHEQEQPVPSATIAAPAAPADAAAAAADEVQHTVPPPAQSSGPSAAVGVRRRSQQAQQQQVQQQDQPASTATLQQAVGSAGTSGGDAKRPRRSDATASAAGAVSAGAAAAPAGGAGQVAAERMTPEAAAAALLKNGGINPVNLPGLEFSHVEWVMQQLGPHLTLSEAQARLNAQQQQGETQGARLDLLYFDQELKDAYHHHTQQRHNHKLFKELDVSMRVSPEALVGRYLRIYWDRDDAWFAGNVVEWDATTARHKVVYDDGEVGWLWMGLERVRLLITAGEELTPPDAATLQQLAQRYCELSKKKNVGPKEREKLKEKGQELLGAAYIKAHQPPPSTWLVKRPVGAGSGGGSSSRGKKRKSIQATVKGINPTAGAAGRLGATTGTPEPASGPAGDAAVAGAAALCGSTAPPEANAAMQQQEEGVLATTPQQQDGPDSGAAKRARLCVPRAEGGTSILKQTLQRQAAQQQQHQQQGARVTFADGDAARSAASSPVVSRGNSPTAAATRDADEGTPGDENAGRDGSGDSGSGSVRFSVRPGEVVWVQVKPNPPWPALVISSEEAADFSVNFNHPRVAQVCIQYFGDYSRARVPVTCLIPTKVALQQQLWLKTVLINRKEPNWINQVKSYRIGLREFITYCKDGVLPDSEMVPEHNDERWLMDECEEERQAATAKDAAAAGKKSHKRKVLGASQPPPPETSVDELLEWAASFVKAVSTGGDAAASPSKAGKARLPLQLGPNLLLVSLGRVEYVHPRFHSDKCIYPVGFVLKRRARIGGDKEVWHMAEILEGPNGSGPLFRVTPDGAPAVEGSNPTAAWQEVYKIAPPIEGMSTKDSAIAVAARAASVCGPRLFGLQHRVVAALIESLPDAALCEGYIAWKGTPPATQPTPPEVLLARRMISAQLSKLPPGVVPQPVQRRGLSLCDSCGEEQEVEGNHLLECDGCGLLVHMGCYGVPSHPNGEAWLCDVCQLLKQPHGSSLSTPPACALCPCVGGMMKPTAEGGWCHLLCAAWVPGCCVADGTKMEPIVGTQRLPKVRLSLRCRLCNQPYGACIQCAHKGCSTAFHASCARAAGYPMLLLEDDSDSEDDVTDDELDNDSAQQQQQQQGQQQAQRQGAALPPSQQRQQGGGELEQQDSEQLTGQQQQRQEKHAAGRKEVSKGRAKARKNYRYRGGTAAGDNTRLVCYCKKHHAFAATLQGKAIHNKATGAAAAAAKAAAGKADSQQEANPSRQSSPAVTAADVAARAIPSRRRSASSVPTSNLGRQMPERQDVMLFGDLVVITSLPGTSARSRVTDLSSRRHLRAPDAAAVAMRKRLYMQSLPHLVTSQPGTVAELLRLPPPISRISYVRDQQQQQQQDEEPSAAAAAAAPAGAGDSGGPVDAAGSSVLQLLQGRLPAAPTSLAAHAAAAAASAGGNTGCGPGPRSAPLSQADRYRRMLSTVSYRLCSGKSAIHGLGVFVKRPHKAGDYLIEYMGHLVRPFMTDHLEQTTYNDMVGAGTYIFQLNDKSSVDATRGGNMAHLINHSCAPVAHSRMITVRDPRTNQLVDHVVIVASKDLQPGDEITYDYRFASEQKLRCNCGAATCRGFVNAPSSGIDTPRRLAGAAALLLPRHEVEILRGMEAVAAAAAAAAFPAKKHLHF